MGSDGYRCLASVAAFGVEADSLETLNAKATSLPVRCGKPTKRKIDPQDNTMKSNTMNPRTKRLMPGGVPRYIRCYDNGGKTVDRYTVVFTGLYRGREGCDYIDMSPAPFHPDGVCYYGWKPTVIDAPQGWAPAIGRCNHMGRRIPFRALPPDCRKVVVQDNMEIWQLP
jgi:hypothetical protein